MVSSLNLSLKSESESCWEMGSGLTVGQIGSFQDAFTRCDTRGEGSIGTQQLRQVPASCRPYVGPKVLRDIGQNPTEAELQDMVNEVSPSII